MDKKNKYYVLIAAILVTSVGVVYALTSIQVTNNVTITSGANIALIFPFITGGSCPTSGYTQSPAAVPWSEPAGGSASQLLCIQNTGTGTDIPSVAITSGNPATCGSGTSPCFSLTISGLPSSILAGGITTTAVTVTLSNIFTLPTSVPGLIITVT